VLPRVSVDIGYFRRVFGNFFATDNRAQNNFTQFQLTVPTDARLPNSGQMVGAFDVDPTQFGLIDNFVTKSDNFGTQTQHWNGVEVNVSARIRQSLFLQGGTSTGRTTTDNCEVRAKLPELGVAAGGIINPYCHVEPPFTTQVEGLASYTVPKVDVLVSAIFRSQANAQPGSDVGTNGASRTATYRMNAAQFLAATGRPIAPGLATQDVNLVLPGAVYGDRINVVDMRIAKVLRFGRYKTNVGLDVYNLRNSNTGTTYENVYDPATNGARWMQPTAVLLPRFMRLNVQLDF